MLHRLRRIPDWAWLAALVVVGASLRGWGASETHGPWISPDEYAYGVLGRSFWTTGQLHVLGVDEGFLSLLYPAFIGFPLTVFGRVDGYEIVKPVQALVMTATAVPVYYWARSLGAGRWSLAAAALTAALPGLAYSGLLMTEVLAYPVVLLAAWASVRALEEPTIPRQLLALAGMLAAAATRLQGAVLVPALVTALVLLVLVERRVALRRYWLLGAGFAVVAVAWVASQLTNDTGGSASSLLAGYQSAGEATYTFSDSLLYTRWHAADLVLLVGVVPLCAVAVLVVRTLRRREEASSVRAYAVYVLALAAWSVVVVAVFASVQVGHLAERQLLPLAPVVFVGFALWLARGAPRPHVETWAVAAVAVLLVATLPVARLVTHGSLPNGFTLAPLWPIRDAPQRLIVILVAVALVAAFVALPRRLLVLLPAALVVLFVAGSVETTRIVHEEAAFAADKGAGPNPRWIDEGAFAGGTTSFLYTPEVFSVAPWASVLWNGSVRRVYDLTGQIVPGPIPQEAAGALPDGRLVLADGSPVLGDYVVAPRSMTLVGDRLADVPSAALILWHVEKPARLREWVQTDTDGSGGLRRLRVLEYGCSGGRLELELESAVRQQVRVRRGATLLASPVLEPGAPWRGAFETEPGRAGANGLCTFSLEPASPRVEVRRLGFVRRPS